MSENGSSTFTKDIANVLTGELLGDFIKYIKRKTRDSQIAEKKVGYTEIRQQAKDLISKAATKGRKKTHRKLSPQGGPRSLIFTKRSQTKSCWSTKNSMKLGRSIPLPMTGIFKSLKRSRSWEELKLPGPILNSSKIILHPFRRNISEPTSRQIIQYLLRELWITTDRYRLWVSKKLDRSNLKSNRV